MKPLQFMHLREQHPKGGYKQNTRGITVMAERVDDHHIRFKWTLNRPDEQFVKKSGALHAQTSPYEVITPCVEGVPMKYQFHNTIASVRRQMINESGFDIASDFMDLTFKALADISETNKWYTPEMMDRVKYIHPDITLNYIHRCQQTLEA